MTQTANGSANRRIKYAAFQPTRGIQKPRMRASVAASPAVVLGHQKNLISNRLRLKKNVSDVMEQ